MTPKHETLGSWLLAIAVLTTACGDSASDGGSDGSSDADGATAADFEGSWISGVCSKDGQGRDITVALVVTKTSDDSISFVEALAVAGAGCKGAVVSTDDPPSPMGTVAFDGNGASGGIAFARGAWTIPSGMVNRSIWALRTKDLLCLLGDQDPSILPDSGDVADYVELLPEETCYARAGTR